MPELSAAVGVVAADDAAGLAVECAGFWTVAGTYGGCAFGAAAAAAAA